jgi:trimethylamine--corrinoid protein Co-methyltransferase
MTQTAEANGRVTLRLLAAEDLTQLDEAACAILERVGVAMPSARAREALGAAGARVVGDVVTFPPEVLRALVARAPASLTMGARAGATLVTGHGSLLTTDGCCTQIYDPHTGELRLTQAADVATVSRLVDALPEIDFCWPAVSAQDFPAERRGLWELYLAIANTGKHVQTVTVVEPRQARVAVEMAAAVAGDAERLREAPPISALLGTVTPLGNDQGTVEASLVFAEAGVPIGFVTMPQGGSTTPITMAGSLAVGIAEMLSSVAAVQAVVPGAPVFVCFIPSIMDLRSGDFTGGAPEDTLMGAAAGDIGRYYGLPTQCGVNASGAKVPGWQSAVDDVATTFLSLLAGVDMLAGVGMVASDMVFSCEEMVLAAELTAAARDVARGLRRDELGATRAALLRGMPYEEWIADGRADAVERARTRVHDLLATHQPPPLRADLEAELRRLAEGAPA